MDVKRLWHNEDDQRKKKHSNHREYNYITVEINTPIEVVKGVVYSKFLHLSKTNTLNCSKDLHYLSKRSLQILLVDVTPHTAHNMSCSAEDTMDSVQLA